MSPDEGSESKSQLCGLFQPFVSQHIFTGDADRRSSRAQGRRRARIQSGAARGKRFVAEKQGLREALGFAPLVWDNVILPVGISFFTFQSMSYVFDVASGRARVLKNPLDFALYVALFPQLIAGPIVRYSIIA